jgi:hypothetical protein
MAISRRSAMATAPTDHNLFHQRPEHPGPPGASVVHARRAEEPAMPDVIACPDPTCSASARIVDRWTWGSSGGPVEHVKTGCERGHWFTPTVESLDRPSARTAVSPALVPVGGPHPALTGAANPSHVTEVLS